MKNAIIVFIFAVLVIMKGIGIFVIGLDAASLFIFLALLFMVYTIEGMSGFGSAILALPFLIYILPASTSITILVALSLIMAVIIVIRNHHHIKWKILLKIIILSGAGIPFGIYIFTLLPEQHIKVAIAIFMIIIGCKGIIQNFRKKDNENEINQEAKKEEYTGKEQRNASVKAEVEAEARSKSEPEIAVEANAESGAAESAETAVPLNKKIKEILYGITVFLGGVVHGAFGIGGPLLIIYAAYAIPKKESFRATLSMMWICLDAILTIKNIFVGNFTKETSMLFLIALPAMLAGLAIGNHLHHRIPQKAFTVIIYVLMLVIGIVSLFIA